jgi:hypothetical protein
LDPNLTADIWIELGSPGEGGVFLHQSINVGNPNGDYVSYSFGWDPTWTNPLQGTVYVDTVKGGDYATWFAKNGIETGDIGSHDYYLKTTAEQDALATKMLDAEIGKHDLYVIGLNTCRQFSQAWFYILGNTVGGVVSPGPVRAPDYANPWRPTVGDVPISATTTDLFK